MPADKPANPYPHPREQDAFKRERERGIHSIFRCGMCLVCRTWISPQYKYCSQACYNKANPDNESTKETAK